MYVYAVFFRATSYHLLYELSVLSALISRCKSFFLNNLCDSINKLLIFITAGKLIKIDLVFHWLDWLKFSLLDTIFWSNIWKDKIASLKLSLNISWNFTFDYKLSSMSGNRKETGHHNFILEKSVTDYWWAVHAKRKRKRRPNNLRFLLIDTSHAGRGFTLEPSHNAYSFFASNLHELHAARMQTERAYFMLHEESGHLEDYQTMSWFTVKKYIPSRVDQNIIDKELGLFLYYFFGCSWTFSTFYSGVGYCIVDARPKGDGHVRLWRRRDWSELQLQTLPR